MQLSTLALVLAAGLPALARPALDTRQTTDPCAGLGDGALSSLSGSITLAALNTNLPNDNSTGVPLTLGLSIASSHDQQWSIQTLASAGGFYTKYQDVTLANGGLVAVVESRLVGKQPVTSGQVAFLWNGNPGPAAPIYCATVRTVLLSWSACETNYSHAL